jgi:transposase
MSTTLNQVCQMLAVVVEISAARWVVASYSGGAGNARRKNLSEDTAAGRFEALVSEVVEARRRFDVSEAARVVVAYEAGQEGFWLLRALRARGIDAVLIDPVSLQVDRRARRAKTDRLDAEALVRALWRWMSGDHRALRMVRMPSVADEDNREWQRERDRLMGEQRGCLDRVRKKLRTQGIWIVLDRRQRQQLREGELRGFDNAPLAPMLRAALVMELDRAEAAKAKLVELEEKLAALSPTAAERIARLTQLRGVGPVGARLLALLLFWRRFDNRRQVGACTGLVGMPYDSGTMRQDQGISKIGDPKLRAVLIELAWLWLRYQPDSAIARWFALRTQGQGKRGKRVMIVAVARKLAIALWRYLEHAEVPPGAQLKRSPATAAA